MPNRLHRRYEHAGKRAAWRVACRAAALPGLDRLLAYGAKLVFGPSAGRAAECADATLPRATSSAMPSPTSPATATARARGRSSRAGGRCRPSSSSSMPIPSIDIPVLLLWAEEDPAYPLAGAQEAFDLIPGAQLRTLPGTGFLMAYDDPVGVARELISFFG